MRARKVPKWSCSTWCEGLAQLRAEPQLQAEPTVNECVCQLLRFPACVPTHPAAASGPLCVCSPQTIWSKSCPCIMHTHMHGCSVDPQHCEVAGRQPSGAYVSVTTLPEPGKGWPHLDLRYCCMRLPNSCLSSLVISPGFNPTDTVASAAAPWGPAPAPSPTPELNPFLTCLCLRDMVEAFPGSGASPGMMLYPRSQETT